VVAAAETPPTSAISANVRDAAWQEQALPYRSGSHAFPQADASKFGRTLSEKTNELKPPRRDAPEREQERHQSGMSCTARPKRIR